MTATTLAVIIEAKINRMIWARCPWPSALFPFGFEFAFDAFTVSKIEECNTPEDVGLTVLSPIAAFVRVRVDNPELLPEAAVRQFDSDTGELLVPCATCDRICGVSVFILLDFILDQEADAVNDALAEVLSVREYKIITITMDNGRVYEKVTAPGISR